MKWLAGGLTFVNVSVVAALLLGMAASGLGRGVAFFATFIGLFFAVWALLATAESYAAPPVVRRPWSRVWFWILAGCFGFFAFRAFCWLIFIDGNQLKVQSPNNLGDLALHFTYIRNLASGVPLWPENPIYVFSHLRYPAGTDLFNSLLLLLGCDLLRGLVWAGLLGSLATFYALYRWGGSFGVAAFLFNGGAAGFQILQTWSFLDYQGDKSIAWKSLPLAMFVTQRGLLYALPAGLLLLYQWRAYFTRPSEATSTVENQTASTAPPLPLWVELSLYATLPFFHLHTFMALSIVAAFLFLVGPHRHQKTTGPGRRRSHSFPRPFWSGPSPTISRRGRSWNGSPAGCRAWMISRDRFSSSGSRISEFSFLWSCCSSLSYSTGLAIFPARSSHRGPLVSRGGGPLRGVYSR